VPVLWIVLAVVVVLVLWAVLAYNSLVRLRNEADQGWANIDVQLKRRADLIPNLVETVKGYATHERGTLDAVVKARAAAVAARDAGPAQRAAVEGELTQVLSRLLVVAEAYPDLKANQNFLALQEELTGTESKIAYARQFYNDQVMRLNTLIASFPSNVLAGLFHFTPREFFDIEDPVRGPAKVEFS